MKQTTILPVDQPAAAQAKPLAARQIDWAPLLLAPALAVAALPLIGSVPTWITLTAAGLAMGMIIFIIASGLTLIFGLMDVLNFGHGVFIALGAFVAVSVLGALPGWSAADDLGLNLAALGLAALAAMLAAGVLGWLFERVLVRQVYGLHLMQILITMGGMVIGEELIKVIWGPQQIPLPLPGALRGVAAAGRGGDRKIPGAGGGGRAGGVHGACCWC